MRDTGISRNALCTCGSGKKYKDCCGQLLQGAVIGTSMSRSTHALIDLGVAQYNSGRLDDAVKTFKSALAADQRSVIILDHLASALLATGQVSDALACYQRIVQVDPESYQTFCKLGNVLFDLGRFDDAINCHRRALALKNDLYDSRVMIGDALRATARVDEASASYRRALDLRPDSTEVLVKVATALRLSGNTAEAEAVCRETINAHPHFALMWAVLGEVLADEGRFAEAEDAFKSALAIDAALPAAWYGMVYVRKQTMDDEPIWMKAKKIAEEQSSPSAELMLRYAVAKYYDDTNHYALAFENYRRANDLGKLLRPPHDRAALARSTEEIIRHYDRKWLDAYSNVENNDDRPVLVVGMMRSGTSLVEQMLASHPQVFAAGELGFWSQNFFGFDSLRTRGQASRKIIEAIGVKHSEMLNAMSSDALRIIDKAPINFLFLGLTHAVLPKARIIHMQRNPVDTCVSIYFQNFEATITYANDLEDLAHTYREYRRLMRHWRDVLPGEVMLDVPYEELVDDPEKWGRKILEFVDLPWDDRCLNFHKTNRTVLTASKWQVRQKINKHSVERWRNYEEFIGPLLSLIE